MKIPKGVAHRVQSVGADQIEQATKAQLSKARLLAVTTRRPAYVIAFQSGDAVCVRVCDGLSARETCDSYNVSAIVAVEPSGDTRSIVLDNWRKEVKP